MQAAQEAVSTFEERVKASQVGAQGISKKAMSSTASGTGRLLMKRNRSSRGQLSKCSFVVLSTDKGDAMRKSLNALTAATTVAVAAVATPTTADARGALHGGQGLSWRLVWKETIFLHHATPRLFNGS